MAEPRGLLIAAPASGSGKTFLTLALLRALRAAGVKVASAKAGPDYIDPRFHEAATGAPCPNLDPWAMAPAQLRALAAQSGGGADLMVIEGVMGLFDGAESGGGSSADLAALLGLPVVLVIDARRQAQSVAALVSGFAGFRADCNVAGIILNRVSSPRHRAILEAALAPLQIPVLGAVGEDPSLNIPSRHLGLVQAGEHEDLEQFLSEAARIAAAGIDLERFAALAAPLPMPASAPALAPLGSRIAIASDAAFSFAYPHLLAGWRHAGAELAPFSPLAGEAPDPAADAIFLPGGYPELHAGRLAASGRFLADLREAAARGVLVYGECGGFMVLGRGLIDAEGGRHAMAGLLPVETDFSRRSLHLGYRRLRHASPLPWAPALRGHEFHYSSLARQGQGEALFEVADSAGRDLGAAGLRLGSAMGSYIHVIAPEAAP
ncbi:MAG: cobyrinate a,c-diamide synthase [Rhodobiaceae bacterium]|nr:cobyrinate a,c-diamide synthase [Rhodobiaceae bacterium]